MTDQLSIQPTSILRQAIKAVPAVKYALGVGGIVSVIAIVVGTFKLGYQVAVFGTVVMFFLMTILVVFSKIAVSEVAVFKTPVIVLIWFFLILLMAVSALLFTSVFFSWPMNFDGPRESHKSIARDVTYNAQKDAARSVSDHEGWGDQFATDAILGANARDLFGKAGKVESATVVNARFNLAKEQWQQALDMAKDADDKTRLKSKLSEDFRLTCTDETLSEKPFRCEPFKSDADVVTLHSKTYILKQRPE